MTKFLQNKAVFLVVLFCLLALANYLPLPWNEPVNNALQDLQMNIRGNRPVSNDIAVVAITDDDIIAMGSWPITRDYYGYFIHAARVLGAKIIAMDVLFASANEDHPEYDTALAQFVESANNVCLPMIYSELVLKDSVKDADYRNLYFGINPMNTYERFKNYAAGTGFSNLGTSGVIRSALLLVNREKGLMPSFGLEAARLFLAPGCSVKYKDGHVILFDQDNTIRVIPTNAHSEMYLNHFGDTGDINVYKFLDVIKNFQDHPESFNFKDKLVFLIVSAPGISNVHSTPLSDTFPASLLHVTVAENIISENFLVELSPFLQTFLTGVLIILAFLIWRFTRKYQLIALGVFVPLCLIIISQFALSAWNNIVQLFYPLLGYMAAIFYLAGGQFSRQKTEDESIKKLMQSEIQLKERQLKTLHSQFNILNEKFIEETNLSEISKRELDKQKDAIRHLEKQLSDLKSYVIPELETMKLEFAEIVYAQGSPMEGILELVKKIGTDDIPVLILGETGTGKELIARAIHQAGDRKDNVFIAINCGALSETLLESELFGHEKGAFTGATNQRKGRFELADNGTVFLDEISETSPAFQAKLLRVLQEGVFERVGGEESIHVNIRIIAATNRQLDKEILSENFRPDLYYRLNGFSISLPPLRERTEDIPILVTHFLKKYEHESVVEISNRAMNLIKTYSWPGNVRELENTVRRAAILAKSGGRKIIQVDDLPKENMNELNIGIHQTLEQQILKMLRSMEFSRSSISQTAKALGNKDRGTITEYFRGICFEQLVKSNFDLDIAVKEIAGSGSGVVLKRVRQKINEYLENLKSSDLKDGQQSPSYKGLPQKFYSSLDRVLEHLHQLI